jgi:Co/Zn/Cd efflux system component
VPRISNWLTSMRRYLLAATAGNLVWEMVQVPLYTIWREGSARDVVQAILHCTVGDALISIIAIFAALILVGSPAWPDQRFGAVLAATIALATGSQSSGRAGPTPNGCQHYHGLEPG